MGLFEELAWWRFYLPRQAVQLLARRLPLAALRDRLPHAVAERLRFGLYPAAIGSVREVPCRREQPDWGVPAALDARRPLAYEAPPRVSILVVTYGNLALTRLCLASLQRAAGPLPFEVIVVDNGSTDGTPEWLREAAALLPLRLIENRHNDGFAAANNQGAAVARGELLVFLNNDCVVVPGWLETLVGHLDGDAALGLVGPMTNSGGNSQAQLATSYRDLDEMARFAAARTEAHRGECTDVAMLPLFCAAMPAGLFRALGGIDTRYGRGLFEDDDLSLAVRRRGRRVAVAGDVFVHHYGGASFSRLPRGEYLRLWWQNRRAYEQKWQTRWVPR